MDSSPPLPGNMNGHSSLHCSSRVIKVEQFSGPAHALLPDQGSDAHNGTAKDESGKKSFVQQRIERLYGPAALGMAFRAKRALLERYKEEKSSVEDAERCAKPDSPLDLPSVFRHLRPEFRHQLPVKPRCGFKLRSSLEKESSCVDGRTEVTNGHRVRHIPIQIEGEERLPSPSASKDKDNDDGIDEKSWKTLSRDLQAVHPDKSDTTITATTDTTPPTKLTSHLKILDLNKNINSSEVEKKPSVPSPEVIKDGNYYLKVADAEVSYLEPLVEAIDRDLSASGDIMPEEVKGKLLAASGKAKLLIRQKVEQFKGLCFKNISKSTTEEFPTTNEDIAGFWDMVSIQVASVKETMEEIDAIRKNGWQEVPLPKREGGGTEAVSKPRKQQQPSASRRAKGATPGGGGKEAAAKQKANDERRRQMREAINARRREAAAANKRNGDAAEHIEIFAPKQ